MSDDRLEPLADDVAALLRGARRDVAIPPAARARLASQFAGAFAGASLVPPPAGPAGQMGAAPRGVRPGAHDAAPAEGGALGLSRAASSGKGLATLAAGKSTIVAASLIAGGIVGAGLDELFVARRLAGAIGGPRASSSQAAYPAVSAPLPLAPSTPTRAESAEPSAPPPAASAPPATAPALPALTHPDAPDHAPARDDTLSAERALIDMARSAVARGQPEAALVALGRHAAEFPRGQLSEEREALWVQALVRTGRRDEARARVERFRRVFPKSMALPALEAATQ